MISSWHQEQAKKAEAKKAEAKKAEAKKAEAKKAEAKKAEAKKAEAKRAEAKKAEAALSSIFFLIAGNPLCFQHRPLSRASALLSEAKLAAAEKKRKELCAQLLHASIVSA